MIHLSLPPRVLGSRICITTPSFLPSLLFAFWDKVSVCSFDCPWNHSVHQAGLEFHRDLPASPSLSSGIKGVPIFTIVFLRVKYSLVFTLSAPPKFTLPLPFLKILTLASVNMTVSIAEPYWLLWYNFLSTSWCLCRN